MDRSEKIVAYQWKKYNQIDSKDTVLLILAEVYIVKADDNEEKLGEETLFTKKLQKQYNKTLESDTRMPKKKLFDSFKISKDFSF